MIPALPQAITETTARHAPPAGESRADAGAANDFLAALSLTAGEAEPDLPETAEASVEVAEGDTPLVAPVTAPPSAATDAARADAVDGMEAADLPAKAFGREVAGDAAARIAGVPDAGTRALASAAGQDSLSTGPLVPPPAKAGLLPDAAVAARAGEGQSPEKPGPLVGVRDGPGAPVSAAPAAAMQAAALPLQASGAIPQKRGGAAVAEDIKPRVAAPGEARGPSPQAVPGAAAVSPSAIAAVASPGIVAVNPVGEAKIAAGLGGADGGGGAVAFELGGGDVSIRSERVAQGGEAPVPAASLPRAILARLQAAIAAPPPPDTAMRTEITLSPAELGRVTFVVSNEDGRLTMQVLAERPETLELVRRHADALERAASDGPIRLKLEQEGPGQGRTGAQGRADAADAGTDGAGPEPDGLQLPPQPAAIRPGRGLDMRL